MRSRNLTNYLTISLAALVCAACSGGGSDDSSTTTTTTADVRGVNGTYLFVTHNGQEFGNDSAEYLYYATRDVGSSDSMTLRIANQGADIYPLTKISLVGNNADEFSTLVFDEITLQPAEFINVDVAFEPITEGEKSASLNIAYDTIVMVDESVNINEQAYYKANELESEGQFRSASIAYQDYLANDPVTSNKTRAAIRLPIINEASTYAEDDELDLYLQAMRERDDKEYAQSLITLNTFATLYPDSYLADDALYLQGYIQLNDLQDPDAALLAMQSLRDTYPDTTYYDTSLYADALAQIDAGNRQDAEQILVALKDRHTGIDIFGIQTPKDNLMSRLWFKRSTQALETLQTTA